METEASLIVSALRGLAAEGWVAHVPSSVLVRAADVLERTEKERADAAARVVDVFDGAVRNADVPLRCVLAGIELERRRAAGPGAAS